MVGTRIMLGVDSLSLSPANVLRACSWLVAVAGIFWFPWYCGVGAAVPGESYALGFNNKAAILALALSLLLALLSHLKAPLPPVALSWLEDPVVLCPSWRSARAEYLVLGLWSAIWVWLLWTWGTYLVDPAWCESRGFIYAMDCMALGRVPYRDFMFNYGPVTLYVPFAISWFSQGDVSFEYSYLITLLTLTVLGFVGVFILARGLNLPSSSRWIPLLLGLSGWSQVSMGLNGVPLRFLVVPASLVLLHAVVRPRVNAGKTGTVQAGCASAAAMFACAAMSPEMGIAGAAGLLAYAFALWLAGAWQLASACMVGCLSPLVVFAFVGSSYFLSVLAFASGGHNFPIYPNAHNVALMAVALFIIPRLIAAALRGRADARAPLALGLAVSGGMLLPAAFGRCDPGHVYFNGMLPFTMMFAATAYSKPVARFAWWCSYGVLFIVLLQFSYWSYYANNFVAAMQMRAFYEQNPQLVETWRQKWESLKAQHPRGKEFHWSSVLPYPDDLDEFTRQGSVLLTAGNEWNLWLTRYLFLQKELPRDYFHAHSQGAATPSQIEQKIRDSKAARFIMIPEFVMAPLSGPIDLVAYGKGLDRFLSGLLFFPVTTTVKHPPFFPDSEIAKRLLEDYKPVFKYQGYVVAERKPTAVKRDSDESGHGDKDRAP